MAKSKEFVLDDKAVAREVNAIVRVFKPVLENDPGKKEMLKKLIEEAAFQKCLMRECRRRLLTEELVTTVENGSQKYLKENPAAKIYSDNSRQYKDYVKTLIEFLPPPERKSKLEEMMRR